MLPTPMNIGTYVDNVGAILTFHAYHLSTSHDRIWYIAMKLRFLLFIYLFIYLFTDIINLDISVGIIETFHGYHPQFH